MPRASARSPSASWTRIGENPADRERSRALTGRDFLTGTSFALTGGSVEAGGYAALWGRGAISRFDGREGELSLDGEVTTGLIGADWASAPGARRWTAGLAVGHARGAAGLPYPDAGAAPQAARVGRRPNRAGNGTTGPAASSSPAVPPRGPAGVPGFAPGYPVRISAAMLSEIRTADSFSQSDARCA